MAALGLLILVAALIVGVVGGLANSGSDHAITNFSLFGADLDISSGRLFVYGAVLGAVGMLGLNLLLAGTGRSIKHRFQSRKNLKAERSRAEELQAERDRLEQELHERESTVNLNDGDANTTGQTSPFQTKADGTHQRR